MKKECKGYECSCERCGHDWKTFIDDPVVCPKCKSPYWSRKRSIDIKSDDEIEFKREGDEGLPLN